jgi:hypothetical protein
MAKDGVSKYSLALVKRGSPVPHGILGGVSKYSLALVKPVGSTLKIPQRINTLIFILAIAFIWGLKTGEYLLEQGHQITIKHLKTRKAKLVSICRLGLDHIKYKLLNFLSLFEELKLLSCT